MKEQFFRTGMLLGEAAIDRLQKARVAVFGLGGVGGYTVEALARSGIGALTSSTTTISAFPISTARFWPPIPQWAWPRQRLPSSG